MTVYHIPLSVPPMGKPRMTQSDRWKKRPCVLRYRAYADELRLRFREQRIDPDVFLERYTLLFGIPTPPSWSKRKRAEHIGKPHRQKPDKDNLEKAVLDALVERDERVFDGRVLKFWTESPRIELEVVEL